MPPDSRRQSPYQTAGSSFSGMRANCVSSRYQQLNAAGLEAFKLRTYRYEEREATFAKCNAEADVQT